MYGDSNDISSSDEEVEIAGVGVEDEEELEVFDSKIVSASAVPVKQKEEEPKSPLGPKRLVALMAASVAKHSGDESFDASALPPPPPSAFTKSTATQPPKAPTSNEGRDAFGIIYKPYKTKSAESYHMPEAEDEELNADLSLKMENLATETETAGDDDDDEFDVDVGTPSGSPSQNIGKRVLATSQDTQAEEAAILAAVSSEFKSKASVQPTETSPEKGESAIAAAVEAHEAVSNMYQDGGAGDMDVRAELSEQRADTTDARAGKQPGRQSLKGLAIAEEEEEEEEKEEENEKDEEDTTNQALPAHISAGKRQELQALAEAVGAFDAAIEPPPTAPSSSDTEGGTVPTKPARFVPTTYTATLEYLHTLDLSAFEQQIVPFEPRQANKSLMTLVGLKADNRKIDTLAITEDGWTSEELLRWPFLLAQQAYDPADPKQLLILQSIYRALVGKHGSHERNANLPAFVPALGPHWDAIGFQGSDPCTDINRAMKLFSLLQALHFVMKHAFGRDARKAYRLSILVPEHPDNHTGKDLSWPFMCVSISFTKEAIVALRTGELNWLCNEKNSVLDVLHSFHRACFALFVELLTKEPLIHHAHHLNTVRAACEGKPAKFLRAYLESSQAAETAAIHNKASKLGFTTRVEEGEEEEERGFVQLENQQVDASQTNDFTDPAATALESNSKAKKFQIN